MTIRNRLLAHLLLATTLPTSPVAARTPTNAVAAFKMIDIYANRSSFLNTTDHVSPTGYSVTLASPPPLMVMRPTPGSPDTMALFNSFAKNATSFEVNGTATQSFATGRALGRGRRHDHILPTRR